MTTLLPIKGTGESVVIGFNFSKEAASVGAPMSVAVTVEASLPGDPNPSAILVGDPQVDSENPARVLQRVAGGADATRYRLQCTALADTGDTLTCPVILPVQAKL
ncbi:MAG TPA: hypothetical protein VIP05_22915 [Burkholderiaceae bacterium]